MSLRQVTDFEAPEVRETEKRLKSALDICVEALKRQGAERFVTTATKNEVNEFNIDGGEFSLFRTTFSYNLSVTAYVGKKKGTATVNKLDRETIEKAVISAVDSAKIAREDDAWVVAPFVPAKKFIKGSPFCDVDRLFMRTNELLETIKREYPLIMLEQVIVSHHSTVSFYRNSSGTEEVQHAGKYNADLCYSGHDGDECSSFNGSSCDAENLDRPFIEAGLMRRELEDTQKQIYTEPFEGKETGVLVAVPNLFEELLESAFGSFSGDFYLLNDTAIWRDKVGQRVADEKLTVAYNVSEPGLIIPQTLTGEGYETEDYTFIENGVLKCLAASSYVANKKGVDRAKNSGGATVITPGDRSLGDIIKSIKKGIFVGRFSGGEPASNGDFSGIAKNSFLIEDGKITKALSETMISGNLEQLVNNIAAISKETVCDGSSVLPYGAFYGVTISGK